MIVVQSLVGILGENQEVDQVIHGGEFGRHAHRHDAQYQDLFYEAEAMTRCLEHVVRRVLGRSAQQPREKRWMKHVEKKNSLPEKKCCWWSLSSQNSGYG